MAFPVIVPRESEEMEQCQVVQWHVQKGERVKQGDILCEVDTGKATFDLEAPADGVVLDIFFCEDEEAPLLTPLAVIGEQGEEYEQFRPKIGPQIGPKFGEVGAGSGGRSSWQSTSEVKTSTDVGPGDSGTQVRRSGGITSREKQPVSPRARRFALRHGIPLDHVQGSGPEGAVVERDLVHWLETLHQ